jgi:hypothetical protein
MKITWQGDLTDDCTAQVGDLFAHCEKLYRDSWHVHICRVDDERFMVGGDYLFHTAEFSGTITTGDMARCIAEAIMRAAGSTKCVCKPQPSRHPCSERVKKLCAK